MPSGIGCRTGLDAQRVASCVHQSAFLIQVKCEISFRGGFSLPLGLGILLSSQSQIKAKIGPWLDALRSAREVDGKESEGKGESSMCGFLCSTLEYRTCIFPILDIFFLS